MEGDVRTVELIEALKTRSCARARTDDGLNVLVEWPLGCGMTLDPGTRLRVVSVRSEGRFRWRPSTLISQTICP